MDFPREGELREIGREKVDGGVGGVTSDSLEKRKGAVEQTSLYRRRQDRVDDGLRLRRGSDESGGAELNG